MRTLVVGIPLPHVSYDNYSFLSAPSLADYSRLIVETEAVSRVVDEVVRGDSEHRTFGGQPVVNGPSSAHSFGLADLLCMRRREVEWLLDHRGTVVVFAAHDVPHEGISDLGVWRRFDWVSEPPGFRWKEHLLPGFGRPGAVLAQEGHPFAPYAETFAARLAYRCVIDERAPQFDEYGTVFLRSHGGVAVGADMRVGEGRVVLLPPPVRFEAERSLLADTLFECLQRLTAAGDACRNSLGSRVNL